MKYRDIPILVAAFAVGAMGAAVEQRVTRIAMPPITFTTDTLIEFDDHSGWWNPAWSYQPGDIWIIGKRSYTTRDIMGRRL